MIIDIIKKHVEELLIQSNILIKKVSKDSDSKNMSDQLESYKQELYRLCNISNKSLESDKLFELYVPNKYLTEGRELKFYGKQYHLISVYIETLFTSSSSKNHRSVVLELSDFLVDKFGFMTVTDENRSVLDDENINHSDKLEKLTNDEYIDYPEFLYITMIFICEYLKKNTNLRT